MKVLLTGIAGFIGSRVAERLVSEGHTVVGYDNLADSYDTRLKKWRLQQLGELAPQVCRYRLQDVTDLPSLHEAWKQDGPFDAVINLAARAGPRQSMADPWTYYATNVIGTINLLELCRRDGVPKFVLASSSSVYGDSPRPFQEDGLTEHPLSPYAASKKAAENICYTYHHLYGTDISAFRFFTVYGPAGRPDMVVFRFIKWIFEGEPVQLFGDGTQERDFSYVDDIARGVIAGLRPVGFQAINLGSDRPVSLNAMIGTLEGHIGKRANVVHLPPNPVDISGTWAVITKAKQLLDWVPMTRFEDGLAECVEWYKRNRAWAKDLSLD